MMEDIFLAWGFRFRAVPLAVPLVSVRSGTYRYLPVGMLWAVGALPHPERLQAVTREDREIQAQ